MEYMDVVDENDKVIKSVEKEQIYLKQLLHRICHVLIFNSQGKLLLQKRSPSVSYLPSYWSTSVGEHVDTGETPEQAAMREMQEELGISKKIHFIKKYLWDSTDEIGLRKFLYIYRLDFNGDFTIDKKVISKIEFFPLYKIKQMITNEDKMHPELVSIIDELNL